MKNIDGKNYYQLVRKPNRNKDHDYHDNHDYHPNHRRPSDYHENDYHSVGGGEISHKYRPAFDYRDFYSKDYHQVIDRVDDVTVDEHGKDHLNNKADIYNSHKMAYNNNNDDGRNKTNKTRYRDDDTNKNVYDENKHEHEDGHTKMTNDNDNPNMHDDDDVDGDPSETYDDDDHAWDRGHRDAHDELKYDNNHDNQLGHDSQENRTSNFCLNTNMYTIT